MAQIAVQDQTISIFGGASALQTASVIVGPSATNEVTVTATGIITWALIPGATTQVWQVFLQPRQSVNQDFSFADEFTVQHIMWQYVGPNDLQITFRVMRTDILLNNPAPVPDIGWGQNLQIDIMLITTPFVQPQ
jgi:hypothetical protein